MIALRNTLPRSACGPPGVLWVVLRHNVWQLLLAGCPCELAEVHEGRRSGRKPDVPAVLPETLGVDGAGALHRLVRRHAPTDEEQMETIEPPHSEQKCCTLRNILRRCWQMLRVA